jgi:hypothetical protein
VSCVWYIQPGGPLVPAAAYPSSRRGRRNAGDHRQSAIAVTKERLIVAEANKTVLDIEYETAAVLARIGERINEAAEKTG